MTKLTRKLFVSLLTVAFALITLGATTFAWFTLSNKAYVEEFEVNVAAGTGIEISVDFVNFYSSLTNDKIASYISGTLHNVTTVDAKTFKKLENGALGNASAADYVTIPLYFRSPVNNVNIYVLQGTNIKSNGIAWLADAAFTKTGGGQATLQESMTLYAANALRIAFVQTSFNPANGTADVQSDFTIFELDPVADGVTFNNTRLETTFPPIAGGALSYYESKTGVDLIASLYPDPAGTTPYPVLPPVYDASNLVAENDLTEAVPGATQEPILILTTSKVVNGQQYYYGMVYVKIWLDGWDPDCFNAILQDKIQIDLRFGGNT